MLAVAAISGVCLTEVTQYLLSLSAAFDEVQEQNLVL